MLFYIIGLLLFIFIFFLNRKAVKYILFLFTTYIVLTFLNYIFYGTYSVKRIEEFFFIILSSIFLISCLKKIKFINTFLLKVQFFNELKRGIEILFANKEIISKKGKYKIKDRLSRYFNLSLNEFLRERQENNYG